MSLKSRQRRDVFHVVQIALGVMMSVLLVAAQLRPQRRPGDRVREIRTQQIVYQVEVKYLSSEKSLR